MSKDGIDALLKRIQEVPPLPQVLRRLCGLLDDTDADIKDVSRIISTDPALTAKLLRLANSSFYGLPRRVSMISQAVVVLGFSGVRSLALGVSLFGFRNQRHRTLSLDRESFWRHSLVVAACARLLAPPLRLKDREEAFVAGLLHDIGKIILMEHYQEAYAGALRASGSGLRLFVAEREAFGIDHAQVGHALCEHWRIPALLTRGIGEHHASDDIGTWIAKDPLVAVVRLADNLAKLYPFGFDGDPHVDPDFLGLLGAGGDLPEQLRRTLLALPSEIDKSMIFFDLQEMPIGQVVHAQVPCRISLRIQDARMRELLRLTVLGLGHTPSIDEPVDLPASAVISDSDGSTSLQTPFLDFRQWLSQHAHADGSINTSELRRWLVGILPDHSNGPLP